MTRRNNQAATQVLIHWDGWPPADATWEFTDELKLQFPTFNLEDKVGFEGGNYYQQRKEKKKIVVQIQIGYLPYAPFCLFP
jgi:hypothetical protein